MKFNCMCFCRVMYIVVRDQYCFLFQSIVTLWMIYNKPLRNLTVCAVAVLFVRDQHCFFFISIYCYIMDDLLQATSEI